MKIIIGICVTIALILFYIFCLSLVKNSNTKDEDEEFDKIINDYIKKK